MKKIILICFGLFHLLSCKSEGNKTSQLKKETQMNFSQDQNIYKIKLSCSLPYKLLLNDLIIDEDDGAEGGAIETNSFVNSFILISGVQHLKIVVQSKKNEDSISTRSLDYINIQIVKLKDINSKNSELINEFNISSAINISKNTYQWEFNTIVPYKLQGWSDSINLLKEDKEELMEEVIKFYTETHKILNSGNASKYQELVSKRYEETLVAFYNNSGIQQEKEELSQRVKDAKDKMNPLKDFVIKFYGNGKIITLENSSGDSPLNYSTEEFDDFFSIQLHRPKKGAPLEVIR